VPLTMSGRALAIPSTTALARASFKVSQASAMFPVITVVLDEHTARKEGKEADRLMLTVVQAERDENAVDDSTGILAEDVPSED